MQKYNINSPALRDPKREWCDAEEVEAELEALKKSQEWRTDWENVGNANMVLVLEDGEIWFHKRAFLYIAALKEKGAKFKIIEP